MITNATIALSVGLFIGCLVGGAIGFLTTFYIFRKVFMKRDQG